MTEFQDRSMKSVNRGRQASVTEQEKEIQSPKSTKSKISEPSLPKVNPDEFNMEKLSNI